MVPDVHGVSPPVARVFTFAGSSTHLSQHCVPHHGFVHATQTLHPRVLWHSLQHSAGEEATVAPLPKPGTITAPSYSVFALPSQVSLLEAVVLLEVVEERFGG